MRTVLRIVAWILALNLAYAVLVALAELRLRWRARREIARLENLWQLDPRGSGRADAARGRRLVGRAALASTALFVLSGVAVASPAAREAVVSTVSGIVAGLTDERGAEMARSTTDEEAPSVPPEPSSGGAAVVEPSRRGDAPRRAEDNTATPEREASDPAPSPTIAPPVSEPGVAPSPSPIDEPPAEESFAVSVADTGPTSIDVTWTDVASATAFVVEYSADGVEWRESGRLPADAREATIDRLEPGVTYQLRVTAALADGGARVDETVATTHAADPPTFSGEEDAPVDP